MPSRAQTPVTVSEELFAQVSPGIELCYQTFGEPEDPALLLVMGLGGPMTWWDAELCEQLARAGFFVVRYDNRDVGRSSRVRGTVTRAQLARAFVGAPVRAPYAITHLAGDAFGLLDHLGIQAAHVVGVSMGGMIVQTMALTAPARVRSLTSVMSTTGKRTVGWQHPRLVTTLLGRGLGREAYVQTSKRLWSVIGSPAYPIDPAQGRARAEETYDRGVSLAGTSRQTLAILTQPDRSTRLRSLRVPTLVVHGLADRMVHVSGGRATAAAVPGAELLLIDGMGHDLPPQLFEVFTDAIARTAARAGS